MKLALLLVLSPAAGYVLFRNATTDAVFFYNMRAATGSYNTTSAELSCGPTNTNASQACSLKQLAAIFTNISKASVAGAYLDLLANSSQITINPCQMDNASLLAQDYAYVQTTAFISNGGDARNIVPATFTSSPVSGVGGWPQTLPSWHFDIACTYNTTTRVMTKTLITTCFRTEDGQAVPYPCPSTAWSLDSSTSSQTGSTWSIRDGSISNAGYPSLINNGFIVSWVYCGTNTYINSNNDTAQDDWNIIRNCGAFGNLPGPWTVNVAAKDTKNLSVSDLAVAFCNSIPCNSMVDIVSQPWNLSSVDVGDQNFVILHGKGRFVSTLTPSENLTRKTWNDSYTYCGSVSDDPFNIYASCNGSGNSPGLWSFSFTQATASVGAIHTSNCQASKEEQGDCPSSAVSSDCTNDTIIPKRCFALAHGGLRNFYGDTEFSNWAAVITTAKSICPQTAITYNWGLVTDCVVSQGVLPLPWKLTFTLGDTWPQSHCQLATSDTANSFIASDICPNDAWSMDPVTKGSWFISNGNATRFSNDKSLDFGRNLIMFQACGNFSWTIPMTCPPITGQSPGYWEVNLDFSNTNALVTTICSDISGAKYSCPITAFSLGMQPYQWGIYAGAGKNFSIADVAFTKKIESASAVCESDSIWNIPLICSITGPVPAPWRVDFNYTVLPPVITSACSNTNCPSTAVSFSGSSLGINTTDNWGVMWGLPKNFGSKELGVVANYKYGQQMCRSYAYPWNIQLTCIINSGVSPDIWRVRANYNTTSALCYTAECRATYVKCPNTAFTFDAAYGSIGIVSGKGGPIQNSDVLNVAYYKNSNYYCGSTGNSQDPWAIMTSCSSSGTSPALWACSYNLGDAAPNCLCNGYACPQTAISFDTPNSAVGIYLGAPAVFNSTLQLQLSPYKLSNAFCGRIWTGPLTCNYTGSLPARWEVSYTQLDQISQVVKCNGDQCPVSAYSLDAKLGQWGIFAGVQKVIDVDDYAYLSKQKCLFNNCPQMSVWVTNFCATASCGANIPPPVSTKSKLPVVPQQIDYVTTSSKAPGSSPTTNSGGTDTGDDSVTSTPSSSSVPSSTDTTNYSQQQQSGDNTIPIVIGIVAFFAVVCTSGISYMFWRYYQEVERDDKIELFQREKLVRGNLATVFSLDNGNAPRKMAGGYSSTGTGSQVAINMSGSDENPFSDPISAFISSWAPRRAA